VYASTPDRAPAARCCRRLELAEDEGVADDRVAVWRGSPPTPRVVQVLDDEGLSNRRAAGRIDPLRIEIAKAVAF
jgi:hypothetical protein